VRFAVRNMSVAPILDGGPSSSELDLGSLVFGGGSGVLPQTGIKALMLAVLEEGIRNYLGTDGRVRSEAAAWIVSDARKSPFAFEVVCESLGLDPGAVRVALRNLREKNVSARMAAGGRIRPNTGRSGQSISGRARLNRRSNAGSWKSNRGAR
jgi:hypothetical protein